MTERPKTDPIIYLILTVGVIIVGPLLILAPPFGLILLAAVVVWYRSQRRAAIAAHQRAAQARYDTWGF